MVHLRCKDVSSGGRIKRGRKEGLEAGTIVKRTGFETELPKVFQADLHNPRMEVRSMRYAYCRTNEERD